MDQYLQALRDREDVTKEVILELEERFKEVVEVVEVVHELSEIEQLKLNQAVQFEIILEMLGGMM